MTMNTLPVIKGRKSLMKKERERDNKKSLKLNSRQRLPSVGWLRAHQLGRIELQYL